MADLLLESAKVGKFVRRGIASLACNTSETQATTTRNRVVAIGLVSPVLADEVEEIPRCSVGNRGKAAEVHQQAAVAVEHDHSAIRTPEGQTEPMRRCEAHRTHRKIVERVWADLYPVERGRIDRDDDVIGDVAGQNAQALVASHHGAVGLRPSNITTGFEWV